MKLLNILLPFLFFALLLNLTFATVSHSEKGLEKTSYTERNSIPIKTPFGKATQEITKDAITARTKVQNGGYMYRLGKRGRSQTGKDAQFWSLEHPKTPGYAQKYGISEENIANADFIERATIKDGSNFVTRKAPAV